MTQSFEDCDWLVVQEGNKRAILRVGFIISLHFEITGIIFPVLPFSFSLSSLSLSLSLSIYIYIYIYIYKPDSKKVGTLYKL